LQNDDVVYAPRSFQKNRKRTPEKELASFLAFELRADRPK
jgi:hypothetical protein